MDTDTDRPHKSDLTESRTPPSTSGDEVERQDSTGQEGESATTRSRSRWWVVGGVALVGVFTVVVAATLIVSNGTEDPTTEPLNTASVQRTDVVVTETLAGTLGFEPADPVTHRTSTEGITTVRGFASGVVTSVVSEGEVLETGDVLYGINTVPVVVLEGDLPVYRSFDSRMSDGADVEQLEQALADLGFDPDGDMTINEDFTSATADAIDRLQESLGAEETGSLDLGYVVFTPEIVYVSEVFVAVGDETGPGSEIIATSRSIAGIATDVASEGLTVGQGESLLKVDEEPILVMIGELPAYRTMSQGDSGSDVLQLELALDALGFAGGGFTVDEEFDESTTMAVVSWQLAAGARPDGVVNLGDVVFLPEAIRVGQALVNVGDVVADGTPLLSTSASVTTVSVELSTDDQDLVVAGDSVVVVMPDDTREAATVTEIGTVVQANQQGDTYFEMTVTLDNPDAAQGLDEAPVDVEVIGDRADAVLAVPVTALIALSEGGYAVEVIASDGSAFLVAVDPGLFADGRVEVSTDGLEDGTIVVIP